MTCIDRDDLITLTAALGADPLPILDHISQCDRCRGDLDDFAVLRREIAEEATVPPGFVDRVLSRIDATDGTPVAEPSSRTRPAPGSAAEILLPAALAGLVFVAMLLLLVASAGGGSMPSPGAMVLISGVAAALATRSVLVQE